MTIPSAKPVRVLLVDDEEIIRYGLNAIFQMDPMIEVVGEGGNGQEAIELAHSLSPDIILMDIAMPQLDGVSATRAIHSALPQIKIIILTTHTETHFLNEALELGAAGYLLKNTPPQDFSAILQASHRGYLQFSPDLGEQLCPAKKKNVQSPPADWQGTTPREREVIQLIAQGSSNREIAQTLSITEKTVKNHVSNILSRLDLRDRTQLAIWAHNLVNLTSSFHQR